MKKHLRNIGERISASLDGAEIMACGYVASMKEQEENIGVAKAKLSPTSLQVLIEEVDSMDLSLSKKESIKALALAESQEPPMKEAGGCND